jgi:hypothetical protein
MNRKFQKCLIAGGVAAVGIPFATVLSCFSLTIAQVTLDPLGWKRSMVQMEEHSKHDAERREAQRLEAKAQEEKKQTTQASDNSIYQPDFDAGYREGLRVASNVREQTGKTWVSRDILVPAAENSAEEGATRSKKSFGAGYIMGFGQIFEIR